MPYKSPFEPALLRRGAVLGAIGDVSVPLHYGDPDREAGALRTGAGLIDLSWRGVIDVTGRDRARFLHGMCTNDIKKLQPGQGCMAAVVNRQGKMVAEMIAHAAENAILLEMDRSNIVPTIEHLQKFLVADDVALRPSDAAVLGLWGPRAQGLLSVKDLPDFHFVIRDGVAVSRNRSLGVEGYHLIVPASKSAEADGILGHGVAPAGFEAHEALRVEFGFPRWGADMDATLLPMEAGLEPLAISYNKGCYIGQEVIQRVKTYSEPPRMLVQLEVERAAPGDKILSGAEEIGAVTSAASSLALGIVRKEFKSPGTELQVGGKPARVRALPWQSRLG
ncbi:MAG: aminomethyltransferase family protein [Planctomycetaceae bacterium]|nr:aminomethyltransferase family protein [Planctomycetaceae bacterium]